MTLQRVSEGDCERNQGRPSADVIIDALKQGRLQTQPFKLQSPTIGRAKSPAYYPLNRTF